MTFDPPGSLPLAVVTGAAGRVGRRTVRVLNGRFRLRLVDTHWPERSELGDLNGPFDEAERVTADLREPSSAPQVVAGAAVLVHLAAQPSPRIDLREALEDVAMPTANLAAALPDSSVRRVVFASSIHAMGLYERHQQHPIDPSWPARPCCPYGTAKVLSENVLRLLVETTEVSVVCLRLGMTGVAPPTAAALGEWLGDDDYGRLLRGAVDADVRFGTYFGVSVRARDHWDVSNAEVELSYTPADVGADPTGPEPKSDEDPGPCLMHRPTLERIHPSN